MPSAAATTLAVVQDTPLAASRLYGALAPDEPSCISLRISSRSSPPVRSPCRGR